MKTTIKLFLTEILITLILSSCSQNPDSIFFASRPVQDVNKTLILEVFSTESLVNQEQLYIRVTNESGNVIWFPDDWGLETLTFDPYSNKWVKVAEQGNTYKMGGKTLEVSGQVKDDYLLLVALVCEDYDQPITVRIYVRGKIIVGALIQDQEVAAYIDVVTCQK